MLKTLAFSAAILISSVVVAEAQKRVSCPVGKTCTAYVVKPGDTLSEITRDVLGTARVWPAIFTENRRRFLSRGGKRKSPHLIYPGQVIVLVR